VLHAPFAGVVSAVFAEVFEELPQQSVMRIIDPEKIEMIVNVPESLISLVPYAVDIKVTFDAFPGVQIPAEISEIGKEPSESVGDDDQECDCTTRRSECEPKRREIAI